MKILMSIICSLIVVIPLEIIFQKNEFLGLLLALLGGILIVVLCILELLGVIAL